MSHLLRAHAPISDAGWEEIDAEAHQRLTPALAARRLVDFEGPRGWEHSATNLGRVEDADSRIDGIVAQRRRVLALVELRAGFRVTRAELRDADRGAADVDFEDLDRAAHRIAEAENVAVFHGLEAAGIEGIVAASPHDAMEVPQHASAYAGVVARAVDVLKRAGLAGPYGMALSREEWTRVVESAEHGGYPLFEHLRLILGGPLVWSPGLEGAVVLSLRGGDFFLETGQDLAVGYDSHDAEAVELYIEESLSFRVATPEAAVAIG